MASQILAQSILDVVIRPGDWVGLSLNDQTGEYEIRELGRSELPEYLDALLRFIRGAAEWKHYGSGIRTYPDGDDSSQKKHEACLELEQRGLIERELNDPDLVTWKPRS